MLLIPPVPSKLSYTEAELSNLIDYLKGDEIAKVLAAIEFATKAHQGVTRKSGEPYIVHPLAVMGYLAEYRLDCNALVAGLLHDIVEDTTYSLEWVEERFGKEVAQIVDGVTKIKNSADLEKRKEKSHPDTLKKFFEYMTTNAQVGLIKLFDRLHNMRTLEHVKRESQIKTANETLKIYAPLANRLGMWAIKNELETLAYSYLEPDSFEEVRKQYMAREAKYERVANRAIGLLKQAFDRQNFPVTDIRISRSNFCSLYLEQKEQGNSLGKSDVLRLTVVVGDPLSCYQAMGIAHTVFTPKPHSFDDYIACPRENMYQGLHTEVRFSSRPLKLRFRTEAMLLISEMGILAKWLDKGRLEMIQKEINAHIGELIKGIKQGLESSDQDSQEAVANVVQNLNEKKIKVYTPRDEVHELAEGATPIDFAYHVHTGVGNTCTGAKVNGELVPLNVALSAEDRVEIIQKHTPQPQRLWLDDTLGYIGINHTKSLVRRWFRRLTDEVARHEGLSLLEEELRLLGLHHQDYEEVASWSGYRSADELCHAIGRCDILTTEVATRVIRHHWQKGAVHQLGRCVQSADGKHYWVEGGVEFKHIHLCRACNPTPPEDLAGFVRKNMHVTIHKKSCAQLKKTSPNTNQLQMKWSSNDTAKEIEVEIEVWDREGLLYEITDILKRESVNIAWINTPRKNAGVRIHTALIIRDPAQLVRVLHRIKALVSVRNLFCRGATG